MPVRRSKSRTWKSTEGTNRQHHCNKRFIKRTSYFAAANAPMLPPDDRVRIGAGTVRSSWM